MINITEPITIYTDGSCDTRLKKGAWAAIILHGTDKTVLTGTEENTTHNRMELTAAIKALDYLMHHFNNIIIINLYTDSQYLIGLKARKEKLTKSAFTTKKGNSNKNTDLVKTLFQHSENLPVDFIKVKAHLKQTDTINYNIEVDKLSRKVMRESLL